MANPAVRSSLKTIHTWIGIVSGLFLSVVALTGSIIVFRSEFERAALPRGDAPGQTRRASLDAAAQEILRLRPDARVRRVRIPSADGDPYVFQVQSKEKRTDHIVSDASTGRVLGTVESGWVDWMIDLHRNLLVGNTGRSLVGVIGIILFVISATGLLMWLTGARSWRAWTSVRRQGSATRFNYELHRASGLWSYAFLALISFTGIELAFPQTFRNAVQSITGKPVTMASPKKVRGEMALSLDEYLRLGRAAMPDGVPMEMRLPDKGKGPVELRLYRAGDLGPSGNHVYLDPASGAVLAVDRIVDRPLGARFLAAFSPIHYAQFGGLTSKIAWSLFGLSPLLLFVTGLIAWWRPKVRVTEKAPKTTGTEDLALAGR
jgi:uncharacterized iron-regulated membrane protein